MRTLNYKITLLLTLICSLLLMVSFVAAQPPGDPDAADDGEVITGIIEFDGSMVYVGPDFAYDPIGQLAQNASVVVLGRRGDFISSWNGDQWLEIQFEDQTGWIYARLIRTSIPFNSIPPTGRRLPRNRNGRVPEVFDLSDNLCDRWQGEFTRTGDFMAGDQKLVVTYPALEGANVYSVIAISPSGQRTAHDSTTTTAEILLENLNSEGGTYTWRVVPYWTNEDDRSSWQQVCLLQTGGTFEKPGPAVTERPQIYRNYFYYNTPRGTPTPEPPLVP